jgi:hypothetical protein
MAPQKSIADVAAALAGVDPNDSDAVSAFYANKFTNYPPSVQELISDFLIHEADTSPENLEALQLSVRAMASDDTPVGSLRFQVIESAEHGNRFMVVDSTCDPTHSTWFVASTETRNDADFIASMYNFTSTDQTGG